MTAAFFCHSEPVIPTFWFVFFRMEKEALMKCQNAPANKIVLSNNPDPCLCWWRSLSFSDVKMKIGFVIEI